jgi:tRNA(Met) C34 N-acetyltransferase TmcA
MEPVRHLNLVFFHSLFSWLINNCLGLYIFLLKFVTYSLFIHDVQRLELYSNNMADHHLVTDLLPTLARLTLTQQLGDLHLSPVQQVTQLVF